MRSVYEACFYGGLILAILLLVLAIILFIVLKIPRVFDELTGRAAKKAMQGKKDGMDTKNSISKQEQKKYYNQSTGKITIRQSTAVPQSINDDKADLDDEEATDVLTWSGDGVASGSEVRAGHDPEITEVLSEDKPKKGKKVKTPTEFLATQVDEEATDVLVTKGDDGTTDVLATETDDEATDVLKTETDGEATDVLKTEIDDEATDVLKTEVDDDATDVLTTEADGDEEATSVLKSEDIDEDATSVLIEADYVKLSRKVKVLYNVIVVHTDEKL